MQVTLTVFLPFSWSSRRARNGRTHGRAAAHASASNTNRVIRYARCRAPAFQTRALMAARDGRIPWNILRETRSAVLAAKISAQVFSRRTCAIRKHCAFVSLLKHFQKQYDHSTGFSFSPCVTFFFSFFPCDADCGCHSRACVPRTLYHKTLLLTVYICSP